MSSKGVLDIEFILSVFVFVSTVSFIVIMVVLGNIPSLHHISTSEDIRSRSYQISEKLLLTEGKPSNWNSNTVTSLGLSSGDMYVLDINKINELGILCSNNNTRFKELLGLDYRNEVRINISYTDGSKIIMCGPSFISQRPESSIDRVGVIKLPGINRTVRMGVSVS